MNEIELKIPLSESDFFRIKDLINNVEKSETLEFSLYEKILKSDEYFSRWKTRGERKKSGEFEVIRIRTEESGGKTKSYFTTKRKSLVNGFEVNDEKESFVEKPEVLRSFLLESGFEIWFTKVKDALSVFCSLKSGGERHHLELEKVNGLFYLEIENVSSGNGEKIEDGKENLQKTFSALEKIVLALGLDVKNSDSRSWVEILKN